MGRLHNNSVAKNSNLPLYRNPSPSKKEWTKPTVKKIGLEEVENKLLQELIWRNMEELPILKSDDEFSVTVLGYSETQDLSIVCWYDFEIKEWLYDGSCEITLSHWAYFQKPILKKIIKLC